jgi:hypothetical protein
MEYPELVLPDEVHGFLRDASRARAYSTSNFLEAKRASNVTP